jgi:hypothetical protein
MISEWQTRTFSVGFENHPLATDHTDGLLVSIGAHPILGEANPAGFTQRTLYQAPDGRFVAERVDYVSGRSPRRRLWSCPTLEEAAQAIDSPVLLAQARRAGHQRGAANGDSRMA